MPIVKYFVFVGATLASVLLGWSAYLTPAQDTPSLEAQAARVAEPFRPTPAPPISEVVDSPIPNLSDPITVVPQPQSAMAVRHHKKSRAVARVHTDRARTTVATTSPDRARTTVATTSPEPFFFWGR